MSDFSTPPWEQKPILHLCEDCGGIIMSDGYCEDCGLEAPDFEQMEREYLLDD